MIYISRRFFSVVGALLGVAWLCCGDDTTIKNWTIRKGDSLVYALGLHISISTNPDQAPYCNTFLVAVQFERTGRLRDCSRITLAATTEDRVRLSVPLETKRISEATEAVTFILDAELLDNSHLVFHSRDQEGAETEYYVYLGTFKGEEKGIAPGQE